MKIVVRLAGLALAAVAPWTVAHAFDIGGLVNAGAKALQAASLSDEQVKNLSDQSCADMDGKHKVAAPGSKYDARLQKIVKPLGTTVNGQKMSFKVYQVDEINAWAMANGCIRVYSGLMDKMTDDEVRGVVAHEIGHVALGHSKKAMQTAYAVSAARDAAASSGNATVTALSASQLGDLSEKLVNAQFSQSQETDADAYAFDKLVQSKQDPRGLLSGFQKLAELEGGQSASILSSHPASSKRAQNIQARLDAMK